MAQVPAPERVQVLVWIQLLWILVLAPELEQEQVRVQEPALVQVLEQALVVVVQVPAQVVRVLAPVQVQEELEQVRVLAVAQPDQQVEALALAVVDFN
jgi:hypothetical protein